MNGRVVRCGNCKTELPETGGEEPAAREPCPRCGSTSRTFEQPLTSTVTVRSSMRVNHNPPKGRSVMVQQLGTSFFRLSGRWHRLHRIIDRRGNRYYERIEDEETSQVVPLVDEPLTEHQGRGSARRKNR